MLYLYCCALIIFILAFLIQFFDLNALFQFNRYKIEEGELWRLWTTHLTHADWHHFWLNMGTLLLIILFPRQPLRSCLLLFILLNASFLFISINLYYFNTELIKYVGFSGTLHTLLIATGLLYLDKSSGFIWLGFIITLYIIAKILYEQLVGSLPSTQFLIKQTIAIDAHLYGTLIGILIIALFKKFYFTTLS